MPESKRCPGCKELKPLEEYNINRSNKDGRADYCVPCNRQISRDRYEKRREHYKADASRRKKLAIEGNSRRVWEYLCAHPCVDCGEKDPVVLEFDHRGDKVMAISVMIARGVGWMKISAEIVKCDVRCANCHRRKTAADRGWRVLLYQADVAQTEERRPVTAEVAGSSPAIGAAAVAALGRRDGWRGIETRHRRQARIAQRQSASVTRKRSLVQLQVRVLSAYGLTDRARDYGSRDGSSILSRRAQGSASSMGERPVHTRGTEVRFLR